MPFLPSSGALSINDIRNLFGGPASPSMANYYRGGAYIPSTKTTAIREPSSGEAFRSPYVSTPNYFWANFNTPEYGPPATRIVWTGSLFIEFGGTGTTSYTSGGFTYFKGNFQFNVGTNEYYYGIFRTGTTTTNINTNVPTSGTISISNFYGAEKP